MSIGNEFQADGAETVSNGTLNSTIPHHRRLTDSVNKTTLKALLAAAANKPAYTTDFPDVKFRVAALKRYRESNPVPASGL